MLGEGFRVETAVKKPKKALQGRQDPRASVDNKRPHSGLGVQREKGEPETVPSKPED